MQVLTEKNTQLSQELEECRAQLKEHAVPPCLVLVIDDNLYRLMVALSYI